MAAEGGGEESARETSRKRIAGGGSRWYQVLGVSIAASPDEVKQAYRTLALLHHPDKGGDSDTFKQVKQAYDQGVLRARLRPPHKARDSGASKGKAKAKAGAKKGPAPKQGKPKAKAKGKKPAAKPKGSAPKPPPPPQPKPGDFAGSAASGLGFDSAGSVKGRKRAATPRPPPVPFDAPRAKLRQALRKWETSKEHRTMPDDVPELAPADVSALLRQRACLLVDAREESEIQAQPCPGAARLSFVGLVAEPEEIVPKVAGLHADARKLVLFTQRGERFGKCGLLGTMLLDLFGFDDDRVHRLAGGYLAWRAFVEGDGVLFAEEALSEAQARKDEAESQAEAARKEVEAWRNAKAEHFEPLVDGQWPGEQDARAHLQMLSAQLATLEAEESLKAMLGMAVRKSPPKRGRWDIAALDEFGRRLADRATKLLVAQQELAAVATNLGVEADVAAERLAAARLVGGGSAPVPATNAPGDEGGASGGAAEGPAGGGEEPVERP